MGRLKGVKSPSTSTILVAKRVYYMYDSHQESPQVTTSMILHCLPPLPSPPPPQKKTPWKGVFTFMVL